MVHALGDGREVLLGREIDRVDVGRQRDLALVEVGVVRAVVIGDLFWVARLLVELDEVIKGSQGFLAVQGDGTIRIEFLAAKRPQDDVGGGVAVAAGLVAHRPAERVTRGLELGAGREQIIEVVGELVVPGLLEPVGPVVHEPVVLPEGQGDPLAAVVALEGRGREVTAAFGAQFLGDRRDVGQALGPSGRRVGKLDDVRAFAGLDRGLDLGGQVGRLALEVDGDTVLGGPILRERVDDGIQFRQEAPRAAQPVDGRALEHDRGLGGASGRCRGGRGSGGRRAGGQRCGASANGDDAGALQKLAARDTVLFLHDVRLLLTII